MHWRVRRRWKSKFAGFIQAYGVTTIPSVGTPGKTLVSTLDEKRLEIEKLLDRCEWHLSQIREMAPEIMQKIGGFRAYCIEHGYADDLPVAIGLLAKLHSMALKYQPSEVAAIMGGSNVV